jgi:hypothetical protein
MSTGFEPAPSSRMSNFPSYRHEPLGHDISEIQAARARAKVDLQALGCFARDRVGSLGMRVRDGGGRFKHSESSRV